MTKKEFWNQLTELMKSPATISEIPALINKARAEHLSIPIVLKRYNNKEPEPVILEAQGKLFVQCATNMSMLQADVGETDLDGFFEDLIDCGYHGIAFISSMGLVGLEWKDFLT